MIVVDHAPHSWFLLQDDIGFVLDVNCNVSAVGFSITMRLAPEESAEIAADGRSATAALAGAVQSNPIGYAGRAGDVALEGAAFAAIRSWQGDLPAG